ncbi:MAG: hypothetical protein R6U50_09490 [Desulfobacterales bacterium]
MNSAEATVEPFLCGEGVVSAKVFEMTERLIDSIELKNGLTVNLYDGSRKIAGDRWYVLVILRIAVPVTEKTVDEALMNASFGRVKRLIGESLLYETKMERHFIDKHEKSQMVANMARSLVLGASSYLSLDSFPKKFLAKSFKTAVERSRWYSDDEGAGNSLEPEFG